MSAYRLIMWMWVTGPLCLIVGSTAMRFTPAYAGIGIGVAVWLLAAYTCARKAA